MIELNETLHTMKQKYGNLVLVIAMEELAELQEQVIRFTLGDGHVEPTAEEMADVYICLGVILIYCNITPEEIEGYTGEISGENPAIIIARMQQMVSKLYREKATGEQLIPPIANTIAAINRIKQVHQISDERINKWYRYKINRAKERFNNAIF